ncbi:hypothetical protein CR513_16578, partial [Mucuna pruriens]
MATHVEAAQDVQEEARFWKDRFIKLDWIVNQAIKSIPKNLRMAELWEKMAQMFQILTQTNVVVTTLVNTNAVRYAHNGYACNVRDLPYGMLQGWNIENATNEEQEQKKAVNNGPMFNASSGAGPNPKEYSGSQHQTSGNPPPFVVHRQAS